MKKHPFALVYHPHFPLHLTGHGHPECPQRYTAIVEALKTQGLWEKALLLESQKAPLAAILRCHTANYIEKVHRECARLQMSNMTSCSLQLSTGDVQICAESSAIALLAAGAGITAAHAVLGNQVDGAFCIVRPPGHHATTSQGMGFCLFNNVAIAARYAQDHFGIRRILIVDWDVHHGNGTQEIFYNDPSVYYFSTHQEGIYPGTGFKEETGLGNIFNCPVVAGPQSRMEIIEAFEQTLPPFMDQFQPQLILISAGFDAHRQDPLGGLNLDTDDFGRLTLAIKKLAEQHCKGKIISFLEGGYNLDALAASACAHVRALG